MPETALQDHVFLGEDHASNERRTRFVIALCLAMMVLEITGGVWFGSIALIADGLHMSTHAGALLLAALAYLFARRHAGDPRFSFGTGKLGDLAGFSSAIVLAMISLLILYEAVTRLLAPVPIDFAEAIPIACLGLVVNIASAWALSGGQHHGHGHGHGHAHGHGAAHEHGHDDAARIATRDGELRLEIFEDGVPPRFRLSAAGGRLPAQAIVQTRRPDGAVQRFELRQAGGYLESIEEIPEPHAFAVELELADGTHRAEFAEHAHLEGDHRTGRDNNMRAAIVHVMADAAVSLLVILGLVLAKVFGWLWMDPLAGILGALVIASWSAGLIRDTGAILLDMTPDRDLAATMRRTFEAEGDRLMDFHLWRLGPGHLGAILCIESSRGFDAAYYRARLQQFPRLSHVTVEVRAR